MGSKRDRDGGATNALEEAVEGMVKDAIQEKRVNGHGGNAVCIADKTPQDRSTQDTLAVSSLFSRIPINEGYYAKVYRRYPVPKEYGARPVFLYDIPQPEIIDDLESELRRLAKENGWISGLYEVQLLQKNQPGILEKVEISLELPPTPPPGSVSGNGAKDPFQQLSESAKFIRELTQQNPGSPGSSPESVIRAVTDAYKSGLEASGKPNQGLNSAEVFKSLVDAVRSLQPAPAPTADPIAQLVQLRKLELESRPRSGEDEFLDKLIKLKAAGFFGEEKHGDPMAAMEKIVTIAATLAASMGGGGGSSSPVVEAIRVFGPQLGQIVTDITGTIKQVTAQRIGGPPPMPPVATRPPVQAQPPLPSPPEPIAPAQPVLQPESRVNPVEPRPHEPPPEVQDMIAAVNAEIKTAVTARDKGFYPRLDQIVQSSAPPAVYQMMLDGKLSYVDMVESVKGIVGEDLAVKAETKGYFEGFLDYLKERKTRGVVAVCPSCQSEFEYRDEASFRMEPQCEDCGTPMELKAGLSLVP